MGSWPTRIAQVHIMRTAGTTVSSYFGHVLSQHDYSVQNSWFQGLHRDWTRGEMESFCEMDAPLFVHNHVRSWSRDLTQFYQARGFFTFSFVRDIGDQLCSLYHWASKRNERVRAISLEEFLRIQLNGGECEGVCHLDWEIPDYWQQFDYVDVFGKASFSGLAELVAEWDPTTKWIQAQNTTANPGYQHYCEQGQISKETRQLLAGSVYQERLEAIRQRQAVKSSRQGHHAIQGMETDCSDR